MDTFSGALAGAAIALLATILGRYLFKIRPGGGLIGGFIVSYIFCALGKRLIPCPGWDVFVEGFCLIPCLAAVGIPWYWWKFVGTPLAPPYATVELWWDGPPHKIQVSPRVARVNQPERLVWVIDAKKDDVVNIQFDEKPVNMKGTRGPFPPRGNAERGKYTTGPGGLATEAMDRERYDGDGNFWPYTVSWTRKTASGTVEDTVDPGVMPR